MDSEKRVLDKSTLPFRQYLTQLKQLRRIAKLSSIDAFTDVNAKNSNELSKVDSTLMLYKAVDN